MKSAISLFFCFCVAFVGWVKFDEVPKISYNAKEWMPSHDGIMEINSAKNMRSLEATNCELEKLRAKEYIEELKRKKNDTVGLN